MEFGPKVSADVGKDISYLELWQPLCSGDRNHLCNFGRMYHVEGFCEIILNLDQWFRRRCRSKVFSYLEVWQPFCSAGCNHLCNFSRGYYVEQFCEIIVKNWSVVQEEMLFKNFLCLEL